jgi:DEAD/DEAH box helicase domain-containing protein
MAKPLHKIFFDIETRNLFQDVGSSDPTALDISVVCVYDSLTEEYSSYPVEDLPKLWPLIERADMLVGYNSDHFDIPILNKYYPGDLSKIKSLDIMKEIKGSLGRRIKLDDIAEATLGKNKSAHGLSAVMWWKQGRIDDIIKYCLEDVKITKEVYEYALANKKLMYKNNGQLTDIKLDTKNWEKKSDTTSLTYTLPF